MNANKTKREYVVLARRRFRGTFLAVVSGLQAALILVPLVTRVNTYMYVGVALSAMMWFVLSVLLERQVVRMYNHSKLTDLVAQIQAEFQQMADSVEEINIAELDDNDENPDGTSAK